MYLIEICVFVKPWQTQVISFESEADAIGALYFAEFEPTFPPPFRPWPMVQTISGIEVSAEPTSPSYVPGRPFLAKLKKLVQGSKEADDAVEAEP